MFPFDHLALFHDIVILDFAITSNTVAVSKNLVSENKDSRFQPTSV